MKVKKIVIIPHKRLSTPRIHSQFRQAFSRVKHLVYPPHYSYNHEILYYGDMPKILGKKNVYILGGFKSYVNSSKIFYSSPYPSLFKTPKATHVDDLSKLPGDINVALISVNAGENTKRGIIWARNYKVPVVLIDTKDPESYEGKQTYDLYKNWDIFFKKDIPIYEKRDKLFPLTPIPIRPESYKKLHLKKTIDIYYSGTERSKWHDDRQQLVELIRKNFKNFKILTHKSAKTYPSRLEYWKDLNSSILNLCPSGKTWDNFRVTESALAYSVVIAPKAFSHTVPYALEDDVNSILYDIKMTDGRASLIKGDRLVKKISHYLSSRKRLQYDLNWFETTMKYHTVTARSKYILDSIEQTL